jgi:DNA-binding GntR family transcriptional regulator
VDHTLSQQVYDQLHHKLRTGSLRPGTRLVNRTLAAELGTSTIPVREAIHRLISEGLLEVMPGAGAFVRSPDLNELGELYDVREVLEVLAAAEAAKYANAPLIAELRAICERFRQIAIAIPPGRHATTTQFHHWLDAEEQFHTRLVAASRNRWLAKVVREIRVITQVFAAQRRASKLLTHAVAQATVEQHEALLEILSRHDIDNAKAWMTAHIRHGRDTVLGFMASEAASRNSKN